MNLARNTVRATSHDLNVRVVAHALVAAKMSTLRSRTTAPGEFRRALQEASALLLSEAARDWETLDQRIETPLADCRVETLRRPVVLVPILRAGLGMVDGMLTLLPDASIGHIGVYRDEKTLQPATYFCRLPPALAEARVVLVDPMLATGNTACQAVALLKKQGAARIQFICLVACPEGVDQLLSQHPDIEIVTAAIDPDLSDAGYIVPGLGDAGDRYFGTA